MLSLYEKNELRNKIFAVLDELESTAKIELCTEKGINMGREYAKKNFKDCTGYINKATICYAETTNEEATMRTEKEIGEIVRRLRGEMSLRDFAKKCDISHTTIDNIEKGYDQRTGKPAQVKVATLQKIAIACGVEISSIMGDDRQWLVDTLARFADFEQVPLQENMVRVAMYSRNGETSFADFTPEQVKLIKGMIDAQKKEKQ